MLDHADRPERFVRPEYLGPPRRLPTGQHSSADLLAYPAPPGPRWIELDET